MECFLYKEFLYQHGVVAIELDRLLERLDSTKAVKVYWTIDDTFGEYSMPVSLASDVVEMEQNVPDWDARKAAIDDILKYDFKDYWEARKASLAVKRSIKFGQLFSIGGWYYRRRAKAAVEKLSTMLIDTLNMD